MMTRLYAAVPGWVIVLAVAGIVASPALVVLSSIVEPDSQMWSTLWSTRLPRMISETVTLLVLVLAGTLILGTTLAWLVSSYDLPARRLLGWLLVIPLAVPGYVAGFVWLDTLSGPLGARGVRNIWLCAATLVLTLYPYVFLFARAAFSVQGAAGRHVARTLGLGPVRTLFRVALPQARPALAAGGALVTMEVLTDIGTVRLFNVGTIGDGVLRVWFGTGDRNAASELAVLLVATALLLIGVERVLRGGSRYSMKPVDRPDRLLELGPVRRVAAFAGAVSVTVLAVGVPLWRLAVWAVEAHRDDTAVTVAGGLGHHLGSSLIVTLITVTSCIVVGTLLALLVRRRGPAGVLLGRLSSLGYALPGPVIAVGAVVTLAAVDRSGVLPAGAVLVGSLVGLVFGLVVRFLAVAFYGMEAGLSRVPVSTVRSARTLGAGPVGVAVRIELPTTRVAALAAVALLTIDIMKELPITLLLRPFGFDTLSVWVWQATSESLWSQAAVPALAMVLTGMIAVGGLLVALERGAEVVS